MKDPIKKILAVIAMIPAVSLAASCNSAPAATTTQLPVTSSAAESIAEAVPAADKTDSMLGRVYIENEKFMVDGKEIWFSGCNTPWYHWNDFGGSMNVPGWEETFARLAEDNINCTRVWVNCNGQMIVNLESTGHIHYVKDEHWDDLDKLFDIADKYGVYVMPTLLSFDHFKNDEEWQTLLQSNELCDEYAEMYVAEFCKRYGERDCIMGIDLMNEPDWVYENDECGKIGWEHLSYLFGKCADVIHSSSSKLVTVGTGMLKYNSDKYDGNKVSDEYLKQLTGLDGAYLDFYSVHYYDWMMSWMEMPYDKSPADFGLPGGKPCMIGEGQNDQEKKFRMTLTEIYKSMYDHGWCGMLVWMETHFDEDPIWYGYNLTREATNAMYDYIPDKLFPLGKTAIPEKEAA